MQYLLLATDYDGTLAKDGYVDGRTVQALERLRDSGRQIVLVTGRQLRELKSIFPQLGMCAAVVAENGGLLYWPDEDREQALAEPPPEEFVAEMRRLQVSPFLVGRVIFASWRPHEVTILETIQRLGIGYHIIFNKDAVMVLPTQVNKATGLQAALRELQISPQNVVAVGDAENDHPFLDSCAVAVAVQNALPALKSRCDLVMQGDHGAGVERIDRRPLSDDLQSLGPRRPRESAL